MWSPGPGSWRGEEPDSPNRIIWTHLWTRHLTLPCLPLTGLRDTQVTTTGRNVLLECGWAGGSQVPASSKAQCTLPSPGEV